jgi:hypothetical protein
MSIADRPDHLPSRRVAIAVPVRDEEERLPACLDALDRAAALWAGRGGGAVTIVALANQCRDRSVAILRDTRLRHATLAWRAVSLLPGCRHAGWARRLAFDAAADLLRDDDDLLLSTDADTLVAPDWLVRNAACLGRADAVAGRAVTIRAERAATGTAGHRRLDLLGRYYTALDYLRAARDPGIEPWPRHYYEGGASIALTRGLYRRIGGAPTPPLAEDRALFDRIRAAGGRVSHPVDVRVATSCRLDGRAPGGMADTVAGWVAQTEDAPLHDTYRLPVALDPDLAVSADRLSFATLPAALAEAQRLIRRHRSGASPQVEPVTLVPVAPPLDHRLPEQGTEFGDRIVAGLGIVGIPGPVDQQEVAA